MKLKNIFKKDQEFKGWSYYFNNHPLMVIFYSLFSVGFGVILLMLAVHLFLLIAGNGTIIPFDIPITFKVTDKDLVINNYLITQLTAATHILNPPTKILSLSFTIIFLYEISALFFLFHFQKIVFSAIEEKPFVIKNVYRLRYIGILLLFVPPIISVLLDQVNYALASTTIIEGFNVTSGRFKFEFLDPLFVMGGFSLILSQVFKIGINMREEQDLSV